MLDSKNNPSQPTTATYYNMSCIVKQHFFGTKNADGKYPYVFNGALFANSIVCVMTNAETKTTLCATYDYNTCPTDKAGNVVSFNNVKSALCNVGDFTKITFISESQVNVVYNLNGATIEFVVKLQPFVMRTDDVVLAEVEKYLETMDETIADMFHWKNMQLDVFDYYLTGKLGDFGLDKVMCVIRKTVACSCGMTFDEMKNHAKFNAIHAKIIAIETFYKNFEQNAEQQCRFFEEKLRLDVKHGIENKELLCNEDLRNFIGSSICKFVDEDLPNNLPIPVFAKGVIVNFKKMKVLTDVDEGMVGIFEDCIAGLMKTEFAKLFPIYTINAGKYAKMIFKVDGSVECFTDDVRDVMLGRFAEINPLLSVDVMKNAFGYDGGIIVEGGSETINALHGDANNEVQQHLISILEEEMAKREVVPSDENRCDICGCKSGFCGYSN